MNRKIGNLVLVTILVLTVVSTAVAAGLYEVTEPTKIVFWHHHEDEWVPHLNEIVERFHAKNPLVTVKPLYVGSYMELKALLIAAIASGEMPALATTDVKDISSYAGAKVTEPLNPYIEASGFDLGDIRQNLVKANTYDGNLIALPYLVSTQVLYYNKTIADAENITLPKTFDEMGDFLEKATVFNADGTTARYGTVFAGWNYWYFMYLYLNNGVDIILEDGLTSDLNSEASVYVTTKMKEWIDKGYAYYAYGTGSSNRLRQDFWEGKAFSVFHTSSVHDIYLRMSPFEIGMVWCPGGRYGDSFRAQIGGPSLLIPAAASQNQKNAAWAFMQFLASPEINLFWADKTGYFPNRISIADMPEYQEYLERKPAMANIIAMADWLEGSNPNPAFDACGNEWKNALYYIFEEGAPVKETLDRLQVTVEEILEDY